MFLFQGLKHAIAEVLPRAEHRKFARHICHALAKK